MPPQIPSPPSLPLGGLLGGNFRCQLDFLSSTGPGSSSVVYAPDGSLATEFALAEAIVLATQTRGSHDPYTCLLNEQADPALLASLGLPGIAPTPLLECLDVGAVNTLAGLGTPDVTLFGSFLPCNGHPVSDGRINAFDLAVLTWAIFRAEPYDQLDLGSQTVIARNGTGARCGDGQTLAEYALALDADFCAAGETAPAADERSGTGARALSEAQSLPQPRCLETAVEPWSAIQDLGEWTRLRFFDEGGVRDQDKLTLAVELSLVGVGDAQVRLTEASPPTRGCVNIVCAPAVDPGGTVTVLLRRRDDLAEGFGGRCGPSDDLTVDTQTMRDRYALGGSGGLSVLLDTPAAACPFDIFLWVPAAVSSALRDREDEPCKGGVGIRPGSTAMDGIAGATQCALFCSGDGDSTQGQLPNVDEGGAAVTIVVVLIVGLLFFCCLFFLLILLLGKKLDMRQKPHTVAGGDGEDAPPAIDNLDPVAIATIEARLNSNY